MADTNATVGAAGADYATVTLAEATLKSVSGNHTLQFVDNVTETGVCDFTAGETYTSLLVYTDTADKHDGTPGSATYVWNLANASNSLSVNNDTVSFEDIEIDASAITGNSGEIIQGGAADTLTMRRCLIHGWRKTSGSSAQGLISTAGSSGQAFFYSNILVDCVCSSAANITAFNFAGHSTSEIIGNTVANISNTNGTSGNVTGINVPDDAAMTAQNNLSYDISSTSGTAVDWQTSSYINLTTGGNVTEDGTSPDGASNQNVTPTFVAAGSNNYLLAAALGKATDLGAVGEDGAIDILDRNRDTEGDTWDAGAHQYVAAGGGLSIPVAMNSYRQRNQLSIG
jgi:hypothetical protein